MPDSTATVLAALAVCAFAALIAAAPALCTR